VTAIKVIVPGEIFAGAERHLHSRAEQVGFFLADWDGGHHAFRVRAWRAVGSEGIALQTDAHVSLDEHAQTEIIKWAWDNNGSLIELHSHGRRGQARFSPSDLWGFTDWVPHLWWRLRGRPYGAIVVAGSWMDALAWISGPHEFEQIRSIEVEGQKCLRPTGETIESMKRRRQGHERSE
jgi:hypothetical protein